jgi:hypothetical protein
MLLLRPDEHRDFGGKFFIAVNKKLEYFHAPA